MKKSILSLCLSLMIMFSACGCVTGSHYTLMSVENNTTTQMSMKYKKFNGYKQTKIKVQKDQPVEVKVDIESNSGTLDAFIRREDDENDFAFRGSDIKTSSFTVTLTNEGTYILRVDAKKHSGSYKFSWEKD